MSIHNFIIQFADGSSKHKTIQASRWERDELFVYFELENDRGEFSQIYSVKVDFIKSIEKTEIQEG